MPVQPAPLTSKKGRPLPVGPDDVGLKIDNPDTNDLLRRILQELTMISLVLSAGLDIDLSSEELEDEI